MECRDGRPRVKTLLQAARTTSIKSVAFAIPGFIMSTFLLHKFFCHQIESILRRRWGFEGKKKKKKKNLIPIAWS